MELFRKPGLGHYNATRSEWVKAYRAARVEAGNGRGVEAGGIRWKAELVLEERSMNDPLNVSGPDRLLASRLIDELLSEEAR